MPATIITTEDLREFKMELLDDIKELLNNQSGPITKRWLKSSEVKALFGFSEKGNIKKDMPFHKKTAPTCGAVLIKQTNV